MPQSNLLNRTIAAHSAVDQIEIARFRELSDTEKLSMLDQACLAAEEIEHSRLAAGLPPSLPAPWPASTWVFLKRHAANVRR